MVDDMTTYDDYGEDAVVVHPTSLSNLTRLFNNTGHLAVDLRVQLVCKVYYLASRLLGLKMTEKGWCGPLHDGILCWAAAAPNTTTSMVCPSQIEGIAYYTEYNVTRYCGMNGVWEKANYSGCEPWIKESDSSMPLIHLKIMYGIYWAGYTLSLIFLALALAIFARYRKLWCLRNIIHSNLILCFALHNITWIVYSFIANEVLTKFYGVEQVTYCYVPTILLKYFIAAGFFWMFVEGVYLFISVIFSFHTRQIRFWMCAFVGWVVPLILILMTTIAKSQGDTIEECWNEQYHLDYIFIGPILCVLMVNLMFLLIIMYVVVTKLQVTVPVEATRYKKAIKALFILCPLLGVNYVFVIVQPTNPLWAKLIFSYYFTVMTSVQGFLVALLFCFRNNEVWITINKSVRKWRRLMKLSSQNTLRESVRSDNTPSMLDFETSSPGRSARHSVQLGTRYVKRQRSDNGQPQQTTKLRNVVIMNDDGEFRLFLPQSYATSSNKLNAAVDKDSNKDACRKQSCPAFRKTSANANQSSNSSRSSANVDPMSLKRPPLTSYGLLRCATSIDESDPK